MEVLQTTVEKLIAMDGFDKVVEEYSELATQGMPKPQYRKEDYLPLEKTARLNVFVVQEAQTAVGFMTTMLAPIPHYGVKCAIVESIFVRKEYRSLGIGARLMAIASNYGRIHSASGVIVSSIYGDTFGKFLESIGFMPQNVSYFCPLTETIPKAIKG